VIKILSSLVVIMGIIHIGATFSPLIGGKLESLDPRTYNAVIYMSLMCGGFLIMLGAYLVWAIDKIYSHPILKNPIRILSLALLVNGVSAIYFMPYNPFAWVTFFLCISTCSLSILRKL